MGNIAIKFEFLAFFGFFLCELHIPPMLCNAMLCYASPVLSNPSHILFFSLKNLHNFFWCAIRQLARASGLRTVGFQPSWPVERYALTCIDICMCSHRLLQVGRSTALGTLNPVITYVLGTVQHRGRITYNG